MLATAVLNPSLGAWADQTDRCKVVTLGVLAQVGHGMRVGTDGKNWENHLDGHWMALRNHMFFWGKKTPLTGGKW